MGLFLKPGGPCGMWTMGLPTIALSLWFHQAFTLLDLACSIILALATLHPLPRNSKFLGCCFQPLKGTPFISSTGLGLSMTRCWLIPTVGSAPQDPVSAYCLTDRQWITSWLWPHLLNPCLDLLSVAHSADQTAGLSWHSGLYWSCTQNRHHWQLQGPRFLFICLFVCCIF